VRLSTLAMVGLILFVGWWAGSNAGTAGTGCIVGDWCQNSEFFRHSTPRRRHETQINNDVETMSALNNFIIHEVL